MAVKADAELGELWDTLPGPPTRAWAWLAEGEQQALRVLYDKAFEAGRASLEADVERANNALRDREKKELEALQELDEVRAQLAEKEAELQSLCDRADRLGVALFEKEAECESLRRICEYTAGVVAAHGRMSERWNPNHVAESFEKDVTMLRAAASKGEPARTDCERHNVSMPAGLECVLCKREPSKGEGDG